VKNAAAASRRLVTRHSRARQRHSPCISGYARAIIPHLTPVNSLSKYAAWPAYAADSRQRLCHRPVIRLCQPGGCAIARPVPARSARQAVGRGLPWPCLASASASLPVRMRLPARCAAWLQARQRQGQAYPPGPAWPVLAPWRPMPGRGAWSCAWLCLPWAVRVPRPCLPCPGPCACLPCRGAWPWLCVPLPACVCPRLRLPCPRARSARVPTPAHRRARECGGPAPDRVLTCGRRAPARGRVVRVPSG
jgi:hypothetical protein